MRLGAFRMNRIPLDARAMKKPEVQRPEPVLFGWQASATIYDGLNLRQRAGNAPLGIRFYGYSATHSPFRNRLESSSRL